MNEDRLENHNYTHHLAQVNVENKVNTLEDIYNENGVLLLKKGSPIDEKAVLSLIKHKLKKSISRSIGVENTLDSEHTLHHFNQFLSANTELKKLHMKLGLERCLQYGCNYFAEFPLLTQKMTVMQSSMPNLFRKEIAGAWYSLAICHQLGLENDETKEIFLGALIRDLGMLHIDPTLLESYKQNDQSAFESLKGHVIIGKMVVNEVENMPQLVKQIIFEHHESCDGAGYPRGIELLNPRSPGQIVAMADSLQEIVSRFQQQGKNLANLEGFLMLNMTTYGEDIYKAVAKLMRLVDAPATLTIDSHHYPEFIDKLLKTNQVFLAICALLSEILPQLNPNSSQKEERIFKKFIERIIDMQNRTGVPSQEYARWMKYIQVNHRNEIYSELEMIGLMYEELTWQANQAQGYILRLNDAGDTSVPLKNLLIKANTAIDEAIHLTEFKRLRG